MEENTVDNALALLEDAIQTAAAAMATLKTAREADSAKLSNGELGSCVLCGCSLERSDEKECGECGILWCQACFAEFQEWRKQKAEVAL